MEFESGKCHVRPNDLAPVARRKEKATPIPGAGIGVWNNARRPVLTLVAAAALAATYLYLSEQSPLLGPNESIASQAQDGRVQEPLPAGPVWEANRSEPDYFPAGYVNRGRDGDGNVKTYEHD